MLIGTRQLTSSIHCSPSNLRCTKFLGALFCSRETLPWSTKECTWPNRILGLLSVLPSINSTNWVSFMFMVIGSCTQTVLLCMVLVMAGLEMISWAHSLATCTADSLLWLAVCLLYVFSAPSLEWHKTESSQALRASEVLLWKNKTHSIRPQCSDLHSRKCLFHALLKKIHDSFSCICPIILLLSYYCPIICPILNFGRTFLWKIVLK